MIKLVAFSCFVLLIVDTASSSSYWNANFGQPQYRSVRETAGQRIGSLQSRLNDVEAAVCGPKPGQSHLLLLKHEMRLGNEKALWKVGPYYKPPRNTTMNIWTSADRAIYSNPYMMIEGSSVKPFVKMTKSDVLLFWHRGGSMVVHSIDENGRYEEKILGDELDDPNANFSTRMAPNTWWAVELVDGEDESSYAFFSTVLVPGWKQEFMVHGTNQEELVRLAGEQRRPLIRRLMQRVDTPDLIVF